MIVFDVAFGILGLLVILLMSIVCVYFCTKIIISIIEIISDYRKRRGELVRQIVDMEVRLRNEMDV